MQTKLRTGYYVQSFIPKWEGWAGPFSKAQAAAQARALRERGINAVVHFVAKGGSAARVNF